MGPSPDVGYVSPKQRQAFADRLLPTLRAAGEMVLRRRLEGCDVRIKPDASPVTAADLASQRLLAAALSDIAPDWPVIGEEDVGLSPAVEPPVFVLLDPLDGTRDYIAGRDEFSINIALIENGAPTVGLVHAPATEQCFVGIAPGLISVHGKEGHFSLNALHGAAHGRQRLLVSRSHPDDVTAALARRLGGGRPRPMGSALKFTMLASGLADLYLRLAPTRGWDTAAGHALVEAAGGVVLDGDGGPLRYSVRQGLRNAAFVAARTRDLGERAVQAWRTMTEDRSVTS